MRGVLLNATTSLGFLLQPSKKKMTPAKTPTRAVATLVDSQSMSPPSYGCKIKETREQKGGGGDYTPIKLPACNHQVSIRLFGARPGLTPDCPQNTKPVLKLR